MIVVYSHKKGIQICTFLGLQIWSIFQNSLTDLHQVYHLLKSDVVSFFATTFLPFHKHFQFFIIQTHRRRPFSYTLQFPVCPLVMTGLATVGSDGSSCMCLDCAPMILRISSSKKSCNEISSAIPLEKVGLFSTWTQSTVSFYSM